MPQLAPIGSVSATPISPAASPEVPKWPAAFSKAGPIRSGPTGTLSDPCVLRVSGVWHMWYSRTRGKIQSIEHMTSLRAEDGWLAMATEIVLSGSAGSDPTGRSQHWETPSVLVLPDARVLLLALRWPGPCPAGLGRMDSIVEFLGDSPSGPFVYQGVARTAEYPWEGYYSQDVEGQMRLRGGPMEPALFTYGTEVRALYAGQSVWYGDSGSSSPGAWGFRVGLMKRVGAGLWQGVSAKPVIPRGAAGSWDSQIVSHVHATPHPVAGTLIAYAGGSGSTPSGLGLAWTGDGGVTVVKYPGNPILTRGSGTGGWDSVEIGGPSILWDAESKLWVLHYHGGPSGDFSQMQIGVANASAGTVPIF